MRLPDRECNIVWRPFAIPKETRTPKIYIVITKNYSDPGIKLFGFILGPVTYSLLLLSHSEMAPVALLLPTRGTSR